jgi:serine/threonine-protein kinase
MSRVLADRYELESPLGAGGQGRVFRGLDRVTKGTVAIKLMDSELEDDPALVARFVQEGRLAARIRDPHLVAALHFGVCDGQRFIVYDYIPGVLPVTALFNRGRIDPARVCDIGLQILDALDTLHEAGVTHQDVSPGNCLWRERATGRLEVFLADLGSAAARSPITGAPPASRELVGTAYYMAPEMLDGEPWDHRVDLWSLGALMYKLLTGYEVDLGADGEPDELEPPAVLVPSIPLGISNAVMGALTSAAQRYRSAAAMSAAIRIALAETAELDRHRRGTPLWIGMGGMLVAVAVTVLGTIGAVWALGTAPVPTESPELAASSLPTRGTADDGPLPAASLPAPAPEMDPRPAPVPVTGSNPAPVPAVDSTPEPTSAPATDSTPAPEPGRDAKRTRRPLRPATLAVVIDAIRKKAGALRACSNDDSISLGVRVSRGRAR